MNEQLPSSNVRCDREPRPRLCWLAIAALFPLGCTTADWSPPSAATPSAPANPVAAGTTGTAAPRSPIAMPAPHSAPPPSLHSVLYARQLDLPRVPELWIHHPEPVVASVARQADEEISRRLGTNNLGDDEKFAALVQRAQARESLWHIEDALSDLDAACRLRPRNVDVELKRAWLLGALSRTSESAAMMPELFRLQRDSTETARVLGLIRFQQGRYDAAAAALGFYAEDPVASVQIRLLQSVAEARATGRPVKSWVLDPITMGESVRWPGPIAGLLLGRIDAAMLLEAARKAPVFPVAEATCQAWFYIGQSELLRGNREAAARALLASVHTRATSAIEYRLATAELIHLGVLSANSLPGTPAW